jgi:hypothetical protein
VPPQLLTQLLDQLLVLVELLEVLHAPGVHPNGLGLLAMLHITQHAHLHVGAGDVRQLHGPRETLVLLGVVVLQTNLQLNGLLELAGLGLSPLQESCGSALIHVL